MSTSRSSGILLHITSLPSSHGIGDLGPEAYRFADFLHESNQSHWQVLPLNPIGPGASPYSSPSTFAGNPLLVSPERLVREGLLTEDDFSNKPNFNEKQVDYRQVIDYKKDLLTTAFRRYERNGNAQFASELAAFRERESRWIDDYAAFRALSEIENTTDWTSWPAGLRDRDQDAIDAALKNHRALAEKHVFWQFLFDRQWKALRSYCHRRNIQLFGDLPIYVAHDSADVWTNQHLFMLDDEGQPTAVAGVPPDYFSDTGQRWGNPLYRWKLMAQNDYAWWTHRLEAVLDRVDVLRLDHFRGFEAYWEIPASEDTAVNGEWVEGPGSDFFATLQKNLGALPLVAEDLGTITPEVRELMRKFKIPGMAVLSFGFASDPTSDYLPHNFTQNLVAYTGTHDTNTFRGWLQEALKGSARENASHGEFALDYLNVNQEDDFADAGVRALMGSVAETVVFPMQDILSLGREARMNIPGNSSGNWRWRLRADQVTADVAKKLKKLTEIYGRKA